MFIRTSIRGKKFAAQFLPADKQIGKLSSFHLLHKTELVVALVGPREGPRKEAEVTTKQNTKYHLYISVPQMCGAFQNTVKEMCSPSLLASLLASIVADRSKSMYMYMKVHTIQFICTRTYSL